MNRELTLREKTLLLILIVLVMAIGYFKLLYEPVSGQIMRCRENTAQEQLEMEQNAVRLAQMEKMEQALADLRADGGRKEIPNFNNRETLLRELRSLLSAAGEYSLDFGGGATQQGYIVLRPVSMTYRTSTYEQSRAIIDRLSASDNINRISDLSICRDERSGGQGYQTVLTVSWRRSAATPTATSTAIHRTDRPAACLAGTPGRARSV